MSQQHPISEGILPAASPPSSSPPTASVASWGAFVLIGFSIAIGQGSTALVTAALSLYLRQLGAPTDRIGLEVTMTGVVVTICTIAVGPFIGRIGAKRLLLVGMAAYLVAAMGMLLFPSEVAVALFRALQGVGAGLALPSALTLAPSIIPARQGTALGLMSALFTLASAVAPPLGLWLFTHGGPSRLFIPAAACALVGIGLGLALPSVPRVTGGWRGFGYDRRWTPELVANVLGNAYFGGIAAYLPLLLARTGGPNAGIFFTADALGVLILRVPSGMVVDRSGPRMAEALGIVLTLLGVGALFLPASILTLALAGAGTGTGAGLLITAVLVSLTGKSDEHNRGTAMGLSTAAYNIGIFLGGAIAGPVASVAGFHGVLGVGLIAAALALPIVLVTHARAPAAVLEGE